MGEIKERVYHEYTFSLFFNQNEGFKARLYHSSLDMKQ